MSKSIVSYKAFLTCLGQELTWNQLQILKAKEGWKIEVHDYGEGVVHHCIKPVEWQDISEKKITFDEDPEKDRVWTFNPVAVAIGLGTLKLRDGWEPRCRRYYGSDVIQWYCRKLEPAVTGLSIEVEIGGGKVDYWFSRLLCISLSKMTQKENQYIERMGPDWKDQVEYYRAVYAGKHEVAEKILKRLKKK